MTRQPAEQSAIADFSEMWQEAQAVSRGEIKGVLTRGDFVVAIGHAYADEVLWLAPPPLRLRRGGFEFTG